MTTQEIISTIGLIGLGGLLKSILDFFILPKQERKKLVGQELWKTKKDAFLDALRLIDNHFAATTFSGPDVPSDYPLAEPPAFNEINKTLALLILICEDSKIPWRFMKFFDPGSLLGDRKEFLILLRRELFGSEVNLPDEIPFYLPQNKSEQATEVIEE